MTQCMLAALTLTNDDHWWRIPSKRVVGWNRRVGELRQRGGRLDSAIELHGALQRTVVCDC